MTHFRWVCLVLAVLALTIFAASSSIAATKDHSIAHNAALKAAHGSHRTLDTQTICNSLVCVQTDEDGDFNIGTADGRTLLYDYPSDPWSTDIRISIDGQRYNLTDENGEDCAGVATFVNETSDANHITDNYTLPVNIAVTVTHTLVLFNDSSAAVLTRTVVTNNSSQAHSIGVLYEYDTMVDDDDAAQLFLGPNRITVETCYNAPFAYPYWDAIPNSGSLVGRGTITGGDAVTPDAIAFGAWGNFYSNCWDDTCSGDDYGDSAVLYRWNEQTVQPGQTRNVATYYGVGGAQSASGALHITVSQPTLSCVLGQIWPNPCQLLVSVTDSTGNTCNNISVHMSDGSGTGGTASITGENPQVISSIEPGDNSAVSFTCQLSPEESGGQIYFTVDITSGNCGQNSLNFSINVPACSEAADDVPGAMVTAYALNQNYPNPFNPTTSIAFDLAKSGSVSLKVFNVAGQEVATLAHGQMERGHHTVSFNAANLPSGVYLYRLDAGTFTATRKMLLMK